MKARNVTYDHLPLTRSGKGGYICEFNAQVEKRGAWKAEVKVNVIILVTGPCSKDGKGKQCLKRGKFTESYPSVWSRAHD